MLAACFSIADREVELLRESDEHPNVVRLEVTIRKCLMQGGEPPLVKKGQRPETFKKRYWDQEVARGRGLVMGNRKKICLLRTGRDLVIGDRKWFGYWQQEEFGY